MLMTNMWVTLSNTLTSDASARSTNIEVPKKVENGPVGYQVAQDSDGNFQMIEEVLIVCFRITPAQERLADQTTNEKSPLCWI